ncbi:MAG: hemerythrin domain-containing protein [Planctomycetes bacterium]|nr:hemerythrin domain-containing protein [Planctomycetota bacterium]
MKRHPSLQPLSHEHHRALLCWRELDKQLSIPHGAALRSAAAALQHYWNSRFSSHMAEEEQLLLDLLSGDLRSRLLAEHDTLRSLFCSLDDQLDSGGPFALDDLASLAATLRAHIRWEERVLFPHLQTHVSPEELRSLGNRLRDRHGLLGTS